MICRKCNGPGKLCIRKEYYYCNECFIINVVHKFRACIGKNKSLFPNEKILICLSGDASSMVLLDLVYNSITLKNYKKLRVIPHVLHVVESERDKTIISKLIEDQCKVYNFNVTFVTIEEYCEKNLKHLYSNGVINQYFDISKQAVSKIPTSISKDINTKIKKNIFINIAKELNCRIVFTAETTTLLASRLLSNIAIGRGSQVENDIGFADVRDENVKILRPMREISIEEVNIYTEIQGLKSVHTKNLKPCSYSLQSVIENFVMNLQDNSPATISTVCKTADKMGSTSSSANQMKCNLCQSNIECKNSNLTAVEASMFSKEVSLRKFEDCDGENLQHISNSNDLMFPLIFESLCYCCSRNVSELNPLYKL